MKIIKLEYNKDLLFLLSLHENEIKLGQIKVKLHNKFGFGQLDIYIEEKYRSKWLTKNFAINIYNSVIETCKNHDIHTLLTKLNNPKSLRLLDFFGFIEYTKNYYYFKIQ